jgi:hypothetical protein
MIISGWLRYRIFSSILDHSDGTFVVKYTFLRLDHFLNPANPFSMSIILPFLKGYRAGYSG